MVLTGLVPSVLQPLGLTTGPLYLQSCCLDRSSSSLPGFLILILCNFSGQVPTRCLLNIRCFCFLALIT